MLDLTRLTEQQRSIVLAPDGPMLVLAGPGCGKTTLLAARVAYLISVRGIDPASVLAMSFTRVAASQLRERLTGLLGEQAKHVEVDTFHALGLRIVKHWQEELGFGPRPLVVYNQHEARHVLKELAEQSDIDLRRTGFEHLAEEVDHFRLDGCCSLELAQIRPLAQAYETLLRTKGALDFPSMLILPLRLLRESSAAAQLYRDIYRHVFADELQDVSPPQYELLRRIAGQHQNLGAVGDVAQTLYAYRGAGIAVFRRFKQDFPDLRVRVLDENFRSTARIVGLANRLGDQLEGAQPLRTGNPDGPPPMVHRALDEQAEATFVAGELLRLLKAGLIASPGEAAVLFRTNTQAHDLIVVLRELGIPYQVAGDSDLFSHPEVGHALAYLRLAVNPDDGPALARIINVPPRRLARLAQRVAIDPCPSGELSEVAQAFGESAVASAEQIWQLIQELHAASALRPAVVLDVVLERTGLADWIAELPDGEVRLNRLEALRRLMERATDGLDVWLDDMALESGSEEPADADRVLLSTIHRAKGREWPVVFVIGLEEGLLPHVRALDGGQAGIEEERRVAYVAMTRARERLYLTYCRRRQRGDLTELRQPSRFLTDLPAEASLRAA